MAIHPNSLANLRAPWPKGVSGNPYGRAKAGAVYVEKIDEMADWSRDQLQAVIDDPSTPAAQLAAARDMLDSTRADYYHATPSEAIHWGAGSKDQSGSLLSTSG